MYPLPGKTTGLLLQLAVATARCFKEGIQPPAADSDAVTLDANMFGLLPALAGLAGDTPNTGPEGTGNFVSGKTGQSGKGNERAFGH
jgi:hypothetical protein